MPKDYNALFQADPMRFMAKYSCNPTSTIEGRTGAADPTGFGTAPSYRYHVMPTADHIAYLDFHKIKQSPDAKTRSDTIRTHHATGQIEVVGNFTPDITKVKSYFLPWLADNIISLTIPAMTALNPGVPYFFTAGINGCSIFIKGTAQSPMIFHAGGNTGQNDPTAGATFWRDMMESHAGTRATTVGANLAEVNKTQYTVDKISTTKHKTPDGTKYSMVNKLGTAQSRSFETWLKKEVAGDYIVEAVAPTGCVMGLRAANGDWSFYLQENVSITYYKFTKSGFFGTTKVKTDSSMNVVMRPLRFTQIYPGQAHVKFVPNLSRVLKD